MSKMKIKFEDQFGIEEKGHDDGGLFKEFMNLLLSKVSAVQAGAQPAVWAVHSQARRSACA